MAIRSGSMKSCSQCRRIQPTYLCADCGVHLCPHPQCINQHRCEPGEGTLAGIIHAETAKCKLVFRAILDMLIVWWYITVTRWWRFKDEIATWTIPQSVKNGYMHISILAVRVWNQASTLASFGQVATLLLSLIHI